jgi:hypothetical protein
MPIAIVCSRCKKRHNAPESFAGLACQCRCGNVVLVPPAAALNVVGRPSVLDELTPTDIERLKTLPTRERDLLVEPVNGPSATAIRFPAPKQVWKQKSSSSSRWLFGCLSLVVGGGLLTVFLGFLALHSLPSLLASGDLGYIAQEGSTDATQSPVEARRGFETVLVRHTAGPQPVAVPPPHLFGIVQYESPAGQLAAYLTPNPGDGHKHPAIIWITGGDCNSIGDVWEAASPENDQTASAFRKAGIVMMFPSLRGGNENPGMREFCLGEVDDVCAAAEFLAAQAYVDPSHIYLGGHSTGGSLVLLAAASSEKFRAVFSFGPVGNVGLYGPEYLPFDLASRRELELRAPIRWLHAIKQPTFVFEGANLPGNAGSIRMMTQATKNSAVHFRLVPHKNHFSVLAPVTELVAAKILHDSGPDCTLDITDAEIHHWVTQ